MPWTMIKFKSHSLSVYLLCVFYFYWLLDTFICVRFTSECMCVCVIGVRDSDDGRWAHYWYSARELNSKFQPDNNSLRIKFHHHQPLENKLSLDWGSGTSSPGSKELQLLSPLMSSPCQKTFDPYLLWWWVNQICMYNPYLRVLSEDYKLHKELRDDPELDNLLMGVYIDFYTSSEQWWSKH